MLPLQKLNYIMHPASIFYKKFLTPINIIPEKTVLQPEENLCGINRYQIPGFSIRNLIWVVDVQYIWLGADSGRVICLPLGKEKRIDAPITSSS